LLYLITIVPEDELAAYRETFDWIVKSLQTE